jgi:hypothetical protein
MMARAQLYEQLQKIGVEMSKKAAQSEFAVSAPAAPDDVLKPGGAGGGPDQGGPGGPGGGGAPGQPPGTPFGPPPQCWVDGVQVDPATVRPVAQENTSGAT